MSGDPWRRAEAATGTPSSRRRCRSAAWRRLGEKAITAEEYAGLTPAQLAELNHAEYTPTGGTDPLAAYTAEPVDVPAEERAAA